MYPLALFGKHDHNLVQFAAGGTNIIIFDHLRQIDDSHGVIFDDAVSIKHR